MNWSDFKQKKLSYRTPLQKGEINKKLSVITEDSNINRRYETGPDRSKTLVGIIDDDSFKISTRGDYFNLFRPTIYGVITESHEGNQIDLRIEMDSVFIAFMAIWFSIVLLILLGILFYIIMTGNLSFSQFIPVLLILIGFSAYQRVIDNEVDKISSILYKTIQAQVL